MTADIAMWQLQLDSWDIAENHGFHEPSIKVGELVKRDASPMERLFLIVSELAEAGEWLRDASSLEDLQPIVYKSDKPSKPDGFAVELADAVIRIAELAEVLKIDLSTAIEVKTAYNRTRPRMHGRQI